LEQVLPLDAGLAHKEKPGQRLSVGNRRALAFRLGPVGWQERLDDLPEYDGK
jgi:hypothetical protein